MFPSANGQKFKNEMQRNAGSKQLANEGGAQRDWKKVKDVSMNQLVSQF